eukprot:comp11741_c0_seq1/m.6330 comp11741_c0_seq1/g.6330  ORF comp11741_c0_seq1/g.6330 comp11741_c0_seq1/m.6330 type:complete len:399 (+) comp11741_c0_seq1:59-1255(+)
MRNTPRSIFIYITSSPKHPSSGSNKSLQLILASLTERLQNVKAVLEIVSLLELNLALGNHRAKAANLLLNEIDAFFGNFLCGFCVNRPSGVVLALRLKLLCCLLGITTLGNGLGNLIKGCNTASLVSEQAAALPVCAALLVQELHQVGLITATVVIRGRLVTGREEFDRGVALNLELLGNIAVLGGIQVGNDTVGLQLEVLRNLLPRGGKGLAVTTPRSIELNEHILVIVQHNLAKVGFGKNGDGGGRLADAGACAELVVDPLNNTIGITGTIVGLGLRRALLEILEGGEPSDPKPLPNVAVCISVHLSKLDLILKLGKCLGRKFVLGLQALAVTAPGGDESNDHVLVAVDNRIEVILIKDSNSTAFLGVNCGEAKSGNAQQSINKLHLQNGLLLPLS